MAGPLAGLKIIEIAGIGPGPFCGMMLADHGAEVIRVERPGGGTGLPDPSKDVLLRSRPTLTIDLKAADGVAAVRELARTADGLIEGFRPGVMERFGLGPDALLADNPRLVYGRMTGWGQDGPYAQVAGHDINYIALAGVLDALGREGEKPYAPLNLVADFGGGGMLLAFGMLAAILHAQRTGQGQVVDCAMVDGSALLMSMFWGLKAMGGMRPERGTNFLDGGAHFYETYATADGKHIALGAIEPQFYGRLRQLIGLADDPDFDRQMDPRAWPALKAKLEALFKSRTRAEWCELLEHSDACFAPVLSMDEAPRHPHNAARGAFVEPDGVTQPAPAPRYSATPTAAPAMPDRRAIDAADVLARFGLPAERVAELTGSGLVS